LAQKECASPHSVYACVTYEMPRRSDQLRQNPAGRSTSGLNAEVCGPWSHCAFRYKAKNDFEVRGSQRHRGAVGKSLPMGPANSHIDSVFTCGADVPDCSKGYAGLDSAAISYTARVKCASTAHKDATERIDRKSEKIRCFQDTSKPQNLRTSTERTVPAENWWPYDVQSEDESSCRARLGKRYEFNRTHSSPPLRNLHHGSTVAELLKHEPNYRKGRTNSSIRREDELLVAENAGYSYSGPRRRRNSRAGAGAADGRGCYPPRLERRAPLEESLDTARARSPSSRDQIPRHLRDQIPTWIHSARSSSSRGARSESPRRSSSQSRDEFADVYDRVLTGDHNASVETRLRNERRLNPGAVPKRLFPVIRNSSDEFVEVVHQHRYPQPPPHSRRPHSARSSSSACGANWQQDESCPSFSDQSSRLEHSGHAAMRAHDEKFRDSGCRALGAYSPALQATQRGSDALPSPRPYWDGRYQEAEGSNDWRNLCETMQANAKQYAQTKELHHKQKNLYTYLRNRERCMRDTLGTGQMVC